MTVIIADTGPVNYLILIGSIEGFLGYGVQWLVVSQRIRPLPYWQVRPQQGTKSQPIKFSSLSFTPFHKQCVLNSKIQTK